MINVIVTGGRYFDCPNRVHDALDQLHAERGIATLHHGGSRVAPDWIVSIWGHSHNVPVTTHVADWEKHGLAAGPICNQQMLEGIQSPKLVLAFPGGKATRDIVTRATKAGVEVVQA